MHRFYVSAERILNERAFITGDELKHLSKVLRLKKGNSLVIFDGNGNEYEGEITHLGEGEAEISILSQQSFPRESPLETWLIQGIPKGDKMELIIQKATELGVRGIIPLDSERSIIKLNEKKKRERHDRWQRIALEAAKQCRRAFVPRVTPICTIGELAKILPIPNVLLVPWEQGGRKLKEVLTELEKENSQDSKAIYIMIGPEGGLEETEVERAKTYGGTPVSLGPRILRTETAGLAVLSVLMYQWGDLG